MRAEHCPTCLRRLSGLVHLCVPLDTPAPKVQRRRPSRSPMDRATYLAQVVAPHGSTKRFEKGCTCEPCMTDGRAARNAYVREWKARRVKG
jgi:hypothetical protein